MSIVTHNELDFTCLNGHTCMRNNLYLLRVAVEPANKGPATLSIIGKFSFLLEIKYGTIIIIVVHNT